jgi:hypothetical protein
MNDFITVNGKKYVTALYHIDGQKRTATDVKDIYQNMTTDMGAMAQLADDDMNEADLLRELMTCDDEIFELYKKDCLD